MSYDVSLHDRKALDVCRFEMPHQFAGGTYQVGGTTEAWLNITYNYSGILFKVIEGGLRSLDNMAARKSIPILENAILQLGNDAHPDYWKPTEGNVKKALSGLLEFAKAFPDGIWDVH